MVITITNNKEGSKRLDLLSINLIYEKFWLKNNFVIRKPEITINISTPMNAPVKSSLLNSITLAW